MYLEKFIQILIFTMITAVVTCGYAQAANETSKPLTQEDEIKLCSTPQEADATAAYVNNIAAIIFKDQGDLSLGSFSPFALNFNNKLGRNIYASAYINVAKKPTDDAIAKTAKLAGLANYEVSAILNGQVNVIRQSTTNLTFDEAMKESEQVKALYQKQLKLTELEAETRGYVQPMQIFSDGDIQNSGFDLLADLDKIDYLLFYDKANVSRGAGIDFLNPAPTDTVKSKTAESEQNEPKPTPSPPPSKLIPAAGSNPTAKPGNQAAPGAPIKSPLPSYIPNPTENRLQCLADAGINSQIDEVIKSPLPINPTEILQEEYIAELSQETQTALSEGSNIEYPEDQKITAEAAYTKKTQEKCNDWICFEVNFNMKKQSLFTDSANCLSCHIISIKDNLNKVVTKNLTPNKLTGNLLEPNKCKKSIGLSGISMNVILVFNPIQTPSDTNTVGKKNMISLNNILKGNLGGDYYDPKKERFITSTSQIQSQTIKSLPADISYQQLSDEIQKSLNRAEIKSAQDLSATIQGNKAYNKADYYQSVSTQIDYMSSYFQAMKISFNDINTNICPVLKNKKDCE